MSTRRRKLSKNEIAQAFADETGAHVPVIITVKQLAAILQVSPKTVYEWVGKGRLDGSFRRRGKHLLIWRDRAIDILFIGPEWTS